MSGNDTNSLAEKGALSAQTEQNFEASKPEETVQDLLNRGASNTEVAKHMLKNMSQEEALEFDTLYKSLRGPQQTARENEKTKAEVTKILKKNL